MKIDGRIHLDTREITRSDWRKLFEKLTFVDADNIEVASYDHDLESGTVTIPRGALDLIPGYVEVDEDLRSRPKLPVLEHVKPLDAGGFSGQRDALAAMGRYPQGMLRLPTGSGKTTIGCARVAEVGTRTLVLAHTKDIVQQWADRAEEEIPGIDVGLIQGDNYSIGHLTVATMQTVRDRFLRDEDFWRQFGCLIIDEDHHAANESYSWITNVCPAYFRYGFSASNKRSDGRQRLRRIQIGPVIYRMPFKSQVPIEVQPVFSNFRSRFNATRYTKLIQELVQDEERNALVARLAQEQVAAGATVVVLSRQIKHLGNIADNFGEEMDGRFAVITGHMSGRKRKEMLDALREGSLSCVLATQLFEEGVDVPRLSCVVLAFPGTDITTLQKVGRVSRRFEGKERSLVIDVVDAHVAVLARQYAQRKAWYKGANLRMLKATDERRRPDAKKEKGRHRFGLRRPERP